MRKVLGASVERMPTPGRQDPEEQEGVVRAQRAAQGQSQAETASTPVMGSSIGSPGMLWRPLWVAAEVEGASVLADILFEGCPRITGNRG